MADCIFCKIVRGELDSKSVYADEAVYAFHDISPAAPVHVLVIPRLHIGRLTDSVAEHQALLGQLLLTAQNVANRLGLAESGYRIVINQGDDAGQIVEHLHLHVLGGAKLGELG